MSTTAAPEKEAARAAELDGVERVPHARPPFTLGELKKAIPPHCFNRSVARSFSYLAVDLALSAVIYWAATRLTPALPAVAWPVYWAVQGCVWTGVWVIAHECGHHAFSDHQWLDDTVGLIFHSLLLVPYFSWKYSHRRHHSNTGSLDRDEVFVPKQRTGVRWYARYLVNNPLGRTATLAFTLFLGWPLYLAFNVSGRPYPRFACHFDPSSPIYNKRERAQIFVSDAAILAVLGLLCRAASVWGLAWVAKAYLGPLAVVNAFLVLITFLQHTHPALPHYDSSEWDWLRGALATVDRDYGFLNTVFHHITDTHVAHHLFSTMPHYHAAEATRAIRPILGDYYRFDPTPVHEAMFRETKECVFVEPDQDTQDKGVFWYKGLTE